MPPAISITTAKNIQTILQKALDQRARFIISTPQEKSSLQDMTGSIRDLGQDGIVVEVSGLNVVPSGWIGAAITCYFKVRDHARKADIFYNFSAPIKDMSGTGSRLILRIALPARLDIGQRRTSLRLDPGADDILGLSLWEEGAMLDKGAEKGRVKLRPPLIGGEHFEQGLALVQDISAGGIRIRLKARLLKKAQPDWQRGTRLVIWLVLAELDQKSHQVLWLKGRIRYISTDYLSKDMEFGTELTHHGKIDQNGKISWAAVVDHDIREIGAWTYQRYLQRFRRGIA
jgi:hypothetical protein